MKLTVLGNTGPYPSPGGACSGYLLEHEGDSIILDFGNGAFANFLKDRKVEDIQCIICSHLHPDHFSDVFVLRYALEIKNLSVPLYIPNEPPLEVASMFYKHIYKIKIISEEKIIKIGNLEVSFKEMRHPVVDYAIKITDGKKTFLYTGDTAYTKELETFAEGVDVMLCDTAFIDDRKSPVHLSVEEACEIANKAKVKTLILTHFNPFGNKHEYYKKGKSIFKGTLLVSEIGKTFDI
ncbi:MAG: MBL fold metallo-hydrolase [Eubacteriaceae bacterium]